MSDYDQKIQAGVEVLNQMRETVPHFEDLYQAFVAHCNYRDPVEDRAQEHLSFFTGEYRIMAGHLYDTLVKKHSAREAVKKLILFEQMPDEDTKSYLLQRGAWKADTQELNPYLYDYVSWFYKALATPPEEREVLSDTTGDGFSFSFYEDADEIGDQVWSMAFIAHEDEIKDAEPGEPRYWPYTSDREDLLKRISEETLGDLGIGGECMECCYEVRGTHEEIVERLTEAGFRYVEDWRDL